MGDVYASSIECAMILLKGVQMILRSSTVLRWAFR